MLTDKIKQAFLTHAVISACLIFSYQSSDLNVYGAKPEPGDSSIQKKKKDRHSSVAAVVDNSKSSSDKDVASIGSRLTAAEVEKLLELHNKIRAEVGVERVTWSSQLAVYAQEWADHLSASGCDLMHRPDSGKWELKYGESLFMGSSGYFNVASAVNFWEEEKPYYRGQKLNSDDLGKCGHYSQVVWRNTKQIGCAKVECKGNLIVVCNYDPAGNLLGEKPY